jgi:cell division protein ZapD
VATIIDITDLLARTDLKAELIKELDRQSVVLGALQANPSVDHTRLESTISSLQNLLSRLRTSGCQPGQTVRKDELIASIRQRLTIPGGTCSFDLPGYHYWLSKPPLQRNAQLQQWLADLRIMQEGVAVILGVVRESAAPTQVIASSGFFQQPLDTHLSYHMIRVLLPTDAPFYPEISAGRHRFTIRFLEQKSTQMRPTQTKADVDFELERCVF